MAIVVAVVDLSQQPAVLKFVSRKSRALALDNVALCAKCATRKRLEQIRQRVTPGDR